MHAVKWYKARLEADPDADVRIIPVGDYVWTVETRSLLWIVRTLAVLLCAINDMVTLASNDQTRRARPNLFRLTPLPSLRTLFQPPPV